MILSNRTVGKRSVFYKTQGFDLIRCNYFPIFQPRCLVIKRQSSMLDNFLGIKDKVDQAEVFMGAWRHWRHYRSPQTLSRVVSK